MMTLNLLICFYGAVNDLDLLGDPDPPVLFRECPHASAAADDEE
jgi:hypothetical protein